MGQTYRRTDTVPLHRTCGILREKSHYHASSVAGPGGLELSPGFYPGSDEQHRLFYASSHNVLVRALLVHPAH